MSKRSQEYHQDEANPKMRCVRDDNCPMLMERFIVRAFEGNTNKVLEYWKDLEGTKWQENSAVVEATIRALVDTYRHDYQTLFVNLQPWIRSLFKFGLRGLNNMNAIRDLWFTMGPIWYRDTDLGYYSLLFDHGGFDALPSELKRKDVLLKALARNTDHWMGPGCPKWDHLNDEDKRDVDFALAAIQGSPFIVHSVWDSVEDKEKLWEWVCVNLEVVPEFFWDLKTLPVSTDPESLLALMERVPEALSCAHSNILTADFVKNVLRDHPDVLGKNGSLYRVTPEVARVLWTEATMKSYLETRHGQIMGLRFVESRVHHSRLADTEFLLAWARCGGHIIHRMDPAAMTEDVFVEYARQNTESSDRTEKAFKKIPMRLRTKNLCRKLIQESHAANFIRFFDYPTVIDDDTCVQALAVSGSLGCELHQLEEELTERLGKRLCTFEGFFRGFLCGMKAPEHPLYRLGAGDTSVVRHIASFLDIPLPAYYFQAAANVRLDVFWPYAVSPCIKFEIGFPQPDYDSE